MNNQSKAIAFLENYKLREQVLCLGPEEVPSKQLTCKLMSLDETECMIEPGTQPDINFYKILATEYDRYIREENLDNVSLKIVGVDQELFSTASNEEELNNLINKARHRFETRLFNSRIDIYPDGSQLDALWFPPIPLGLGKFSQEETETIRENISNFFSKELGLLMKDVTLSITDEGGGMESWFYNHYFNSEQFLKVLGISKQLSLHSFLEEQEVEPILSYVQKDRMDVLKSKVCNQLSAPFGLDLEVPKELSEASFRYFFLPRFKVRLNIWPEDSIGHIVTSINDHFEVLDWTTFDGKLYVECMAHEGPPANTSSEIVSNINELGPYVMNTLCDMGLEVLKIQFVLTCAY